MSIKYDLEKSELIYSSDYIKFFKDTIKINNEIKAYREYIYYPNSVGVIPITDENKVIMVNQYRYANKITSLEIPAGKLEEGEDIIEGVHRELIEETGYDAKELIKMYEYYPAISYSKEKLTIFIARKLIKKVQSLDEDEFIEVKIYSFKEILNMIKENKIVDSKTILSILYYILFYASDEEIKIKFPKL